MPRYITKAVGWCEDDIDPDTQSFVPMLEVDGPAIADTGLITTDGDSIYRVQPPIGFGRNDEW